MPPVSRRIEDDKQFGVSVGKKSHIVQGTFHLAVLQTADGLTHHIRIVDRTNKMLRYVLRHDQREYLVMLSMVEVVEGAQVTCLICASKGPERADDDEPEDRPVDGG
jgi:hypothetical protein